MTSVTIRRAATTTVAAALFIALLAGCSPEEGPLDDIPAPEGQADVFEFQTGFYSPENGELKVRLPEGLIEAAQAEDGVFITGVKAMARKLESAQFCAVDFTPDYANGGAKKLFAREFTEAEIEEKIQQTFEENLLGEYDTKDPKIAVQRMMDEYGMTRESADQYIEDVRAMAEGYNTNLSYWYNMTGADDMSELDETDPERGIYVSEDFSTITRVGSCAASPSQESDGIKFEFPMAGSDENRASLIATVNLSVMKSGTVSVVMSETPGYVLDTEGNWIVG